MSDFLSIGVLWARSIERDFPKVEFYEQAFYSLQKAFNVEDVSEFLDVLGIEPLERNNSERDTDSMFRKSWIVRFLWFRAMMIEVQDPYWNVIEGDIWGLSSHPSDEEALKTVDEGVDFYYHIVKEFTSGLPRLDKAICTHLGWKYEGSLGNIIESYYNSESYIHVHS